MFHLIKYELRGKRFTIFAVCITVIIGNLFLMTKIQSGGIAVPVLSAFLGGAALVLMFISSLSMMSDYLYNEQGYLLFTLPQSGRSILVSRLISAVSQMTIVGIVVVIMFLGIDRDKIVQAFFRNVEMGEMLYSVLLSLWSLVSLFILIYFCMVVGKVALRGKMLGKIGSFTIFFILTVGRNGVDVIVENFFPQMIQFASITAFTVNIGSTIVDFIIVTLLFMATAYLLEYKVDL